MNFFQRAFLVLITTITFALPGHGASPEADVKQVVETFYRDYFQDFVKKEVKGDYDAKLINWVNANPHTSPHFKTGLAKAVRDARKADPQLGLESDPIIDAQDHPNKGYRAKSIKIKGDKAAVTMEGFDDKIFHISLELVNSKGQWLIDRIGPIPPR